jgi:hypothetical protein
MQITTRIIVRAMRDHRRGVGTARRAGDGHEALPKPIPRWGHKFSLAIGTRLAEVCVPREIIVKH